MECSSYLLVFCWRREGFSNDFHSDLKKKKSSNHEPRATSLRVHISLSGSGEIKPEFIILEIYAPTSKQLKLSSLSLATQVSCPPPSPPIPTHPHPTHLFLPPQHSFQPSGPNSGHVGSPSSSAVPVFHGLRPPLVGCLLSGGWFWVSFSSQIMCRGSGSTWLGDP